jgi:hypothetical protein
VAAATAATRFRGQRALLRNQPIPLGAFPLAFALLVTALGLMERDHLLALSADARLSGRSISRICAWSSAISRYTEGAHEQVCKRH